MLKLFQSNAVRFMCFALVFDIVVLTGLTLLYKKKHEQQRELHCINAACEKLCDGKPLKRHEGCIK